MPRYIPVPAYPDKMPVDISFVFESEKPAGKHGFVRADGDVLRFEDGTPVKFWGVNFNGGACFPDKDYAPKVAARLAQAGCNIVRMHQLDAQWDTPNIFSYSKGKRVKTTRVLDPKSMDHLDYLIHCLKQEGIYIYLDMITYRKFKEGDDVPFHEKLMDAAKPWSLIDPRMIELQKEYCTQLWTHVNPYTGLAYKDDPSFVLTEIANEHDLFQGSPLKKREYQHIDYYVDMFRHGFRDWLAERNIEFDWENCNLYCTDMPMIEYKMDLTTKYYDAMYEHLRSIGVRIPIAGTNWTRCDGFIKTHENMDFTDSHHYYYDWKWSNTDRVCANNSITSSPVVFPNLGRMKLPGKPFFISEWDMPWPNSYRAEGPIYYAAVGALQNWSGFTIHTYSYSPRLERGSILGRELSTPVGGVPYREGIFSTWNDPAKFGLFYHSALILRRGDVAPADKKVLAYSTDLSKVQATANQGLLEQHQVATGFDETLPVGFDEAVPANKAYPHPTPGKIVSDNGQLWRDLKKRVGAVDTDRTKIFYGFLGLAGNTASNKVRDFTGISMNGLTVDCKTDFAVVALSSLTDDPICKSDNMLLTTVGRVRNTDAIFDGEKMLDPGKPPIMAEVIQADIHLETEHGASLKVWGVNAEGFYSGAVPTKYEDGVLSFTVGDEENPACYYLIVKE